MATRKANEPIQIQPSGGLADSIYSGIPNSLAEMVGWDIHKQPGILNVRQKLTKDSGATVDEEVDVMVASTDGNTYSFSKTSGKIWKRTSAGTWSLVHTTTPEQGGAGCLGAKEFANYIYWATEKRLHRIAVSKTSDWTNAVEDWAELNLDQGERGNNDFTYALGTSVSELATDKDTYTPEQSPQEGVALHVAAKGTGNWTVKVHDSSNNEVATSTILTASMINGWNFFNYVATFDPTPGDSYHYHVYSSVADGTTHCAVTSDFSSAHIKIYTTSDPEWHPMIEQNLVLFIGDRNMVHQVEDNVFSRNALDVNAPLRIKCFGVLDTDLLIGTYIADNVNKTRIYRWNTYSVSFTNSDPIDEVGINAFLPGDNYVIVNAGMAGSLYIYNGVKLEQFMTVPPTLPGGYDPDSTATVYPNAVGNLNGQILFGFSNSAGNPASQGVYCLGRHNRNYPLVMDLSFPISERSGSDFVLTGIQITSILVFGNNVLVAWKNGSSYGIDLLDYDNKLDGAYLITRSMVQNRISLDNFGPVTLAHEPMPANCFLVIQTALNGGSFNILARRQDDDRNITFTEVTEEAARFQVQVNATASGNNAPTLELIEIGVGG